jgi:hypothetical protein
MSKIKIGEYFNPAQHLVFHQDKEGNMIGGGYQVNNLLYQHKMPLFVSAGDGNASNMGGGGAGAGGSASGGGHDHAENKHFIPEKFSDLFQDLAVPAGLFMMPALFRPRNYAFETPEPEEEVITRQSKRTVDHDKEGHSDSDSDSEGDTDSDHGREHTKQVPGDIFDTLLSMVTPTERIQHDVKTRRRRGGGGVGAERKAGHRKNRTRRHKAGTVQDE